LQRLSDTIQLAMSTLANAVEQQVSSGQGVSASELISQHSNDLVHKPIHSHVSEAVSRVKEVTAEMADMAIDQRVSIGREYSDIPPRGKRVVIVEDNAASMQEVTAILEKNGCETFCFSYGSDFAREVDSLSADIVLLDLTLPDMPAFHLIEKIKKSPSLSNAKLFVMAQAGDREKVELVLGMGVNEVIIKPIDDQIMAFKLKHY
ncbi:MAG: response regulator, partial [Oceanospirillales bacterium]|nr:response regulator [Oceanospirillales bacterium]